MQISFYRSQKGSKKKQQKPLQQITRKQSSLFYGLPLSIRIIFSIVFILFGIYCLNLLMLGEAIATAVMVSNNLIYTPIVSENADENNVGSGYIRWLSFEVPIEVMRQALNYDVLSYNKEVPIDWVQLIAYGAAKNWGNFEEGKKCKDIDEVVVKLQKGEMMEELTKDLKLYNHYLESYSAVLGGFVGEFEMEEKDPNDPEKKIYVKKYGLKVFSPIAKGYGYSHYKDFGVARDYGYKRKHLGNDLMGGVGTPIVAIEDGYVEIMGWNQFGGWRIGIRSNDKKRYYYYAHLKKDMPFVSTLKEGEQVQAGDVIGYLGMTGYSTNENINNIKVPHLHFGMQIIFDQSQKDGVNQIWIDVYQIINFLEKHRMQVYKDPETKDFVRSVNINNTPID